MTMGIHLPISHLHRLDGTTWSYVLPPQEGRQADAVEEISMQIPSFARGKDAYELVSVFASVFERNKPALTRSLFRKGFRIRIQKPGSPIDGTWKVSMHKAASIFRRLVHSAVTTVLELDPFTRQIKKEKSATVDIKKDPQTCLGAIFNSIFGITFSHSSDRGLDPIFKSSARNLILDPAQRIRFQTFRDPFTRLASRCFKTIETFFVMETKHQGSYRFVFDDSLNLRLEENSVPENPRELLLYQEQNRRCVRTYRDFIANEFGRCILAQIEASYNIHFDAMIEQGLPLFPDHVSKCNIGSNNIEIYILERLWNRLQLMKADLDETKKTPSLWATLSLSSAADYMAHLIASIPFSIRALRGIFRSIPRVSSSSEEPTVADLDSFLTTLIDDRPAASVRDLPYTLFNAIVNFVMPSERERKKSLTGRRIRHVSIMGYNTMGKPNTPNPCRDLCELLHIFPDLQQTEDWKNFFELLSHVVVKKTLLRPTPGTAEHQPLFHVGFLIPAPRSPLGEARWYCTDAYLNDGQGNVNYVLLPACTSYRSSEGRTLPMIKLYRSTASNRNADSWQDSIAADFNPHGAPGSLQPEISFEYERAHFEDRTMPLWMGHLLVALQMKRRNSKAISFDIDQEELFLTEYRQHMIEAIELCKKYLQDFHPLEDTSRTDACLEGEDVAAAEGILIDYGHRFREDPRYKIHQDIALVGHSLGGALAQAGTYAFSAKINRIPLPGHQFICYSSDGPAIDNWKDAEFMKFGQKQRRLFEALHIRWKIYHQFEYGDFVPEVGGSHLGTTNYHPWKDKRWISDSITVFQPLTSAKALSIVGAPTHGRRIGTAVLERDYIITKLSPLELQKYDHSWWLRHRIGKIWGYRFFNSPRTSELVRRNVSRIVAIPLRIFNYFVRKDIGDRDQHGVSWQINPRPRLAAEQYTI